MTLWPIRFFPSFWKWRVGQRWGFTFRLNIDIGPWPKDQDVEPPSGAEVPHLTLSHRPLAKLETRHRRRDE